MKEFTVRETKVKGVQMWEVLNDNGKPVNGLAFSDKLSADRYASRLNRLFVYKDDDITTQNGTGPEVSG